VLEGEVLVIELGAVDRLSACAIAGREVTTLNHELLDDTVEAWALVGEFMPRLAFALLTGTEGTESSYNSKVMRPSFLLPIEMSKNTRLRFLSSAMVLRWLGCVWWWESTSVVWIEKSESWSSGVS
jgi:hypothetical protein